jgi:hypothetical protein
LLETDVGAALLSQTGSAATIDVIDTVSAANKVTVYFADTDASPITGTQDHEWRAFVDIDGRLVTVSARGLASAPLGQSTGAALLDAAVAAVMAANTV